MTKELEGFEKYTFYDDGRVWSKSKKCFMKLSLNVDGYPQTMIIGTHAKNGYRRSTTIHRLIAMAFVPNPFGYKEVNHIDGNKANNHYTNLEWCDRSHNLSHAHRLGLRSSKGINNGNYKTGKFVSL